MATQLLFKLLTLVGYLITTISGFRDSCGCAPINVYSKPVCGSNGVTYPSACRAKCRGIRTYTLGMCSRKRGLYEASCAECPDVWEPVCAGGDITYPNQCHARCQGLTETRPGVCFSSRGSRVVARAAPCNCPPLNAPVCGANGNTYWNSCVAKCAKQPIKHKGICG